MTPLSPVAEPDRCRDGSSRLARSIAHTRHGHTKNRTYSPTYHSWQAMMARCRYVERDVEAMDPFSMELVAKARAAIAKARGEA